MVNCKDRNITYPSIRNDDVRQNLCSGCGKKPVTAQVWTSLRLYENIQV